MTAHNFNPRAPYGARPDNRNRHTSDSEISIHAPHTGRDSSETVVQREEEIFQSTRPIRGATGNVGLRIRINNDFNPRAPYGARRCFALVIRLIKGISIHAPHTGRDLLYRRIRSKVFDFNPRAPYGARHGRRRGVSQRRKISIHAPHTGRDVICHSVVATNLISIHAPHTGRDCSGSRGCCSRKRFQSTRPIRGATNGITTCARLGHHFNPRAPYGARLSQHPPLIQQRGDFNPRAPYGARLSTGGLGFSKDGDFNPRAPYGARRNSTTDITNITQFQSTRPIRGAT